MNANSMFYLVKKIQHDSNVEFFFLFCKLSDVYACYLYLLVCMQIISFKKMCENMKETTIYINTFLKTFKK